MCINLKTFRTLAVKAKSSCIIRLMCKSFFCVCTFWRNSLPCRCTRASLKNEWNINSDEVIARLIYYGEYLWISRICSNFLKLSTEIHSQYSEYSLYSDKNIGDYPLACELSEQQEKCGNLFSNFMKKTWNCWLLLQMFEMLITHS